MDPGAFYKNLFRPALEAVGLPASRPPPQATPASKACGYTTSAIRSPRYSSRREYTSCRFEVAGAQHLYP